MDQEELDQVSMVARNTLEQVESLWHSRRISYEVFHAYMLVWTKGADRFASYDDWSSDDPKIREMAKKMCEISGIPVGRVLG